MNKDTMIIKAIKVDRGWTLIDEEGNLAQEGLVHKTRKKAYEDAACLWPWNSTWSGCKVSSGYRIFID